MTDSDHTTNKPLELGFEPKFVSIKLADIYPLRVLSSELLMGSKFQRIFTSIQEIGLVESLVVCRIKGKKTRYHLLDGHLRIEALKKLEIKETNCLISLEDEFYSYNKHINRIAPIQEYQTIKRTIERGVSESKIAKVLNLDIYSIKKRRNLLTGICDEAAELLKDKMVAMGVFPILRKMFPIRQIEAVTFMNDAGIYSISFAKSILAGTRDDQLVVKRTGKNANKLSSEQVFRMRTEMENVSREYEVIEKDYGLDNLNFTVVKNYVARLLGNINVNHYLAGHHPDLLTELQEITELSNLNE